jgi:hypothetical protein
MASPPQRLTLSQLQRIKKWHVAHKADHPLEYQLLDMVLMLWVMGWVGWLPALAFEAPWALPLCGLGVALPQLYVGWRIRAHRAQRLRCDWLNLCAWPTVRE